MLTNWTPSRIRLETSLIELRWPSMQDLDDLASRGAEGVHDPDFMPFFSAWTDGADEAVSHRVLQRHWAALGAWKPAEWTLYLVVVHDGVVVGSQSIGARNYGATREVLLTSWLGKQFQGKGIGTHARGAMLHLAFEGLGADYAFSVVRRGNTASQAVCKKFGFERDGVQINAVRDAQVTSDRFRLDRATWRGNHVVDVTMDGVAEARPMFGLGGAASPVGLANSSPETLSGVQYGDN